MPIPADQIDADARKIIRRLVKYEHQAYLVGGCVRDLLLERSPKDFDIATSATPNEVKALFRNCRIIGRRFRLAHIFFGPKIIETATFRANPREVEAEGAASSGEPEPSDILIRRDNVFGTAEEDARRRDFTINGLFYDIEADEVIDYVGGLHDLAGRTVRTIGEPDIRFREDPVRILRAIKFAARLDFDIEPATWRAILDHQGEIAKCAPPRVLEEIYRLLRGGAGRRSIEILRDTGLLGSLIPDVARLLAERPGSDEARYLWRVLERIDATKSTPDRQPTNAVLLCALAGALVGPGLLDDNDARAREITGAIDRITGLQLTEMRAARRDVERARQILLTLRRLAPSKRRRGKAVALVRRDWFAEALAVYELLSHAFGDSAAHVATSDEEIERWRKLLAEGAAIGEAGPDGLSGGVGADGQDGTDGTAASTEAGAAPGGKRRRRRRRGGRRGQGGEPASFELDELDEDPLEADLNRARAEAAAEAAPMSAAAGGTAEAQSSAAPPSTGSTTPVR